MFPTGRNQDPKVTLLQDGRFALDRDSQTTIVTAVEGRPILSPKAVQWTDMALSLGHDQPYLVAVLSKTVEVRTEENMLIQTLELPKSKLVSVSGQGRIYIASPTFVWTLNMVPVSEQVPQLIKDKLFDLAVTLGQWKLTLDIEIECFVHFSNNMR